MAAHPEYADDVPAQKQIFLYWIVLGHALRNLWKNSRKCPPFLRQNNWCIEIDFSW
jgi:hypothetical protein